MSTMIENSLIASTLFGKTRRRILGLLFTNPDQKFYVREIIRKVDCGQSSVQRELVKLENAGLINMEVEGRHMYFSANKSSQVFQELQNLMLKTYGLVDVIRSSLKGISDRIEYAFIFGSYARGTYKATRSDIDLMIIGNVSSLEISKALREAKETLVKEINAENYSSNEFRNSCKKSSFLQIVLNEPLIMLIGDEDDLRRLG
jgi:predicted nucleotidyltransferase